MICIEIKPNNKESKFMNILHKNFIFCAVIATSRETKQLIQRMVFTKDAEYWYKIK